MDKIVHFDIQADNLKWAQKRATMSISINKAIVLGCSLKKGQALYSYIAQDEKGRAIMVAYLDGKEKV